MVVRVLTLVTLRWCWVWVVKWDTLHALHQVLLMGYLGVRTNSKVKEHYCVWNDWCVLNAMYEFIWCYDHCICLYEVCEVYCVIVPMLVKFLPKGFLHDFKVKCPLQMHVFAWLTYLLHSCTNTILLHLFTQSVGYGCLKDVSKVKGLICVSQTQERDPSDSRISYVLFMFKLM